MTRPRLSVLLALAAVSALPGAGFADDAPLIIGRRERQPILTLDPIRGSFALLGIYQDQTINSGGQVTDSTNLLLQQQLTLSTSGGIVSKNLIDWRASGTVGLNEEWTHETAENKSSFGTFNAYDLGATILRTSELPVSLFALRDESYINRSFASLLHSVNTAYGGNVNWRSSVLPSSLSLSRISTTQSDLGGNLQYAINQNQLQFNTHYEPFERQALDVNYQYVNIAQTNTGSANTNYEQQNLSASHNWGLDRDGRFILSQLFTYNDQTGDFPYSNLRLDELLRMYLANNLEASLDYNFDRQGYLNSQSDKNSFSASVTHRLFQSLTTTGNLGYSMTDNSFPGLNAGSFSNQNLWGNIGMNYNKKAFQGQLSANAFVGFSQTDTGAIGTTHQVVGDTQTFSDSQPIVLTRAGLDPSTIAVFDSAGIRRFVEGIDYAVRTVNGVVMLDRQIGGNINPGDTVRLNYDILPLPGYSSATNSLRLGLRHQFTEGWLKGLSLFSQYSQQNQTINSSVPSLLRPDNIRDTLIGAEYQFWKLTLHAEQEWYDSTLAPYDALRFSARYSDRLGERTNLSLAAAQYFLTYPSDGSRDNVTTFDGNLEYQIMRDLRAIISARWRNSDDSRLGRNEGFEQQGELRWKIRQTDIFLLIRHTDLDAFGTTNSSLLCQFGITRNF